MLYWIVPGIYCWLVESQLTFPEGIWCIYPTFMLNRYQITMSQHVNYFLNIILLHLWKRVSGKGVRSIIKELAIQTMANVIVNWSLPFYSQNETVESLAILTNGHTCRAEAEEATVYSLRAEGLAADEITWKRFSSIFRAELISETDARATSTEPTSLQIPVDFSTDEVAIVSLSLAIRFH